MKNAAISCILSFVACAYAQNRQSLTQATVLRVKKRDNYKSAPGTNPADAPLTAEVYSYDISVRVKCTVLSGVYESSFNYLPSAVAADQTIPVRVGKHRMHFNVPGYGELAVPIAKRSRDRSSTCAEVNSSSGQ